MTPWHRCDTLPSHPDAAVAGATPEGGFVAPGFPDADRHQEEGAIAVDQVEETTIIPETPRGRVMRMGADGSRRPDMGQLASLALRSTALIVISIVLILVLLPAALVAAGT